MMRKLTPEQVTALRQLRAHLPEARILLVGASALGLHLDMTWRATADLDVCVAIGIEDLSRISSIAGWTRHPALEHRWTTTEGAVVDIVPADDAALRAGEVRWPEGGQVMSLVGFRAAFRSAVDADVGGVVVGLPPASAIVLLKMVAYLDRPADRVKDLKDIAYTIDRHLADDDPTRFDDPSIRDLELDHGETGAFLLGRALAGIVDADEMAAVLAFLAMAEDEADRHATGVKLARDAPHSWGGELDDREASLRRFIRALKLGLQQAPPRP
ncbi:MAG: hypothetical protein U0166_11745 [Acidobacteriota bacterium]